MFAAILTCGLATMALSACSSDDDDKTEGKTEVLMIYYAKVSSDVLKVADVEVNYVDQTGAKKKEVMTSTEWKKTFSTNELPLTEAIWPRIIPKASVASGNYQLSAVAVAGYQATLPNGKKIFDGYGDDIDAPVTATAQTADEIAAWCAQSGFIAFTVSDTGYAKATTVDFGGNGDDDDEEDPELIEARKRSRRGSTHNDEYIDRICEFFMKLIGANPVDCYPD